MIGKKPSQRPDAPRNAGRARPRADLRVEPDPRAQKKKKPLPRHSAEPLGQPYRERAAPAKKAIDPKSDNLKPAEVEQFFTALARQTPEPKGELIAPNPFTFLVSVVLSAQATDKSVNKATGPLFAVADTPEKIAALGEARLAQFIRTIGLYQTKAKNVVALSKALLGGHGGSVPHDRAALEALPGVGRKTANVVLNAAFGEPVIAVDTHVFRVANRTGLAPGANVRTVEDRLMEVVPERFKHSAHHWLILHGRYVCVARAPKCGTCVVRDICRFDQKPEI